jgi:hypothetical protein
MFGKNCQFDGPTKDQGLLLLLLLLLFQFFEVGGLPIIYKEGLAKFGYRPE